MASPFFPPMDHQHPSPSESWQADDIIDWNAVVDWSAGFHQPTAGLDDSQGPRPGEAGVGRGRLKAVAEDPGLKLASCSQGYTFDPLSYPSNDFQSEDSHQSALAQQGGSEFATFGESEDSILNSHLMSSELPSISAFVESGSLESGQQQHSFHPTEGCTCTVCLGVGTVDYVPTCLAQNCSWKPSGADWYEARKEHEKDAHDGRIIWPCRYPACNKLLGLINGKTSSDGYNYARPNHEKKHFIVVDASGSQKYHCNFEKCNFRSVKWTDLLRHCTAKHCTNPNVEIFPCPVFDCNYSGANGFKRKDKLTSHYKNVHKGTATRSLAPRAIRPKPATRS